MTGPVGEQGPRGELRSIESWSCGKRVHPINCCCLEQVPRASRDLLDDQVLESKARKALAASMDPRVTLVNPDKWDPQGWLVSKVNPEILDHREFPEPRDPKVNEVSPVRVGVRGYPAHVVIKATPDRLVHVAKMVKRVTLALVSACPRRETGVIKAREARLDPQDNRDLLENREIVAPLDLRELKDRRVREARLVQLVHLDRKVQLVSPEMRDQLDHPE